MPTAHATSSLSARCKLLCTRLRLRTTAGGDTISNLSVHIKSFHLPIRSAISVAAVVALAPPAGRIALQVSVSARKGSSTSTKTTSACNKRY